MVRSMTPEAMPSLITPTLSLDDQAWIKREMRAPLVWVAVWTVRSLQVLTP